MKKCLFIFQNGMIKISSELTNYKKKEFEKGERSRRTNC